MEKILVVAAHPDDEILGVGGTVRRLANEGKEINALIMAEGLSSRNDRREETASSDLEELKNMAKEAAEIIGYKSISFCGLPDNRMDDLNLLDVIKKIESIIDRLRPDTVFTHHHGDLNLDHRITNEAVLTACRPVKGHPVRSIYTFETPSSTEWNYNNAEPFEPNVFIDITDTLKAKLDGMSCYTTESRDYPHPRSLEALDALASYRGSNAGCDKAEGFVLLRQIL